MKELWVEKYRPKVLDNFIGNDNIKNVFREFIRNQDIPNILLYGRSGSGKTSLAKLLVNTIDCEYIYINMSDENNVDTVRNKIKGFASRISFSKMKVIIGDEMDYTTPNAQAALRNIIEEFSEHTRFIFTCNYINKVIEPIISRCQTFEIAPMSKIDIARALNVILSNEEIKFNLEDLKKIVDNYYPDIRRIINESQKLVIDNKLIYIESKLIDNDYKVKVLNLLKSGPRGSKTFNNIRQIISDNSVKDFSDMYLFLFENIDYFSNDNNIMENIIFIQEAQYQDSFSIDKEICFMALIANLLK